MMDALAVVYGAAIFLVFAGLAAVMATRNLLKVVFGLQSMTLGSLLLLAAASSGGAHGAVLVAAVAATASESTAIAVLVLVYRRFGTLDPRKISELRW